MDEARVRVAFKATLKRAGLPRRFSPHSARHTYASLMLAKGAPLVWVSNQLGHSSLQVTLDWYSWAVPDASRSAADLLDSPRPALAAAVLVTSGDQDRRVPEAANPQVADSATEAWSRRWDLNPRPADYESAALPLSYIGPVGRARNVCESVAF